MPRSSSDISLHIVSGKGGTGKTTVAAALALALAGQGKRVMLMEVEGRQGLAQLFDTAPLPYEETKLAVAPGGGEVWGLAVDPEEALLEYLEMFYNLRRAGSVLRKMGAIDFVTTVAPGLRDVLLTGKAVELVRRKDKGSPSPYDAVVLDAPPTGRITRFLNVNTEIAGLAKVGPIRNQADSVMSVLRSPRTAVHLTTLLEEMPVQETIDGVGELQDAALPMGGIIVTMTRSQPLSAEALERAGSTGLSRSEVASDVARAGLGSVRSKQGRAVTDALLAEAKDHAARVHLETVERERIQSLGIPVYELPFLAGGIDLASLYELASMLTEEGMA
ncbi:MAG: ArsA-related P-loop ATPase [Candidatus Nanopelagicales bacterium]